MNEELFIIVNGTALSNAQATVLRDAVVHLYEKLDDPERMTASGLSSADYGYHLAAVERLLRRPDSRRHTELELRVAALEREVAQLVRERRDGRFEGA